MNQRTLSDLFRTTDARIVGRVADTRYSHRPGLNWIFVDIGLAGLVHFSAPSHLDLPIDRRVVLRLVGATERPPSDTCLSTATGPQLVLCTNADVGNNAASPREPFRAEASTPIGSTFGKATGDNTTINHMEMLVLTTDLTG